MGGLWLDSMTRNISMPFCKLSKQTLIWRKQGIGPSCKQPRRSTNMGTILCSIFLVMWSMYCKSMISRAVGTNSSTNSKNSLPHTNSRRYCCWAPCLGSLSMILRLLAPIQKYSTSPVTKLNWIWNHSVHARNYLTIPIRMTLQKCLRELA
jgi:hypothetical protein